MRTESRKIRLADGSSIDVFMSMNWLEVPIETVATIRAALDVLMALDVGPTPAAAKPPPAPPDESPPAPADSNRHACGFEDCDRVFATIGARAIHRAKTHGVGKKQERQRVADEDAAPAETSQVVDEVVDLTEPQLFICHTCVERSDSYADLTDHTRRWHGRYPTIAERRGEEPEIDDVAEEDTPVEPETDDEPSVARAYFCDDCDWTSDDGRDLFKHTQKSHARVPHTWERSVRTAAERVSS